MSSILGKVAHAMPALYLAKAGKKPKVFLCSHVRILFSEYIISTPFLDMSQWHYLTKHR
ncbi:MAG: hypothetical protein WC782_11765 [Methylococcaceae bacterium]